MLNTPKALRLHISLFGRRNVGKSSLFNRLLHQQVSIVSDVAGTTTDPVEKAMELQPIGPVLFVDTAGVDDTGALGGLRVEKTRQVVRRTDLAVLVTDAWTEFEKGLLALFAEQNIPCVVVANKADQRADRALEEAARAAGAVRVVTAVASTGEGVEDARRAILEAVPPEFIESNLIVADLIRPGDCVVLVVPIDKEAPKGRLILPQVQTIRDLLDHDAQALVVKERELPQALASLRAPPALVVTDSQAFLKVAADVPEAVPMTSFSILFARFKGDLPALVRGAAAIERLRPGSRVLVAEACTHHPITDDIGRVKLPRWLEQYVGGKLEITHTAGRDFPDDVHGYDLVIHCGACTLNRREMLWRIGRARADEVPVTNYGLAIAYCLGVFERALRPFPAAYAAYRDELAAAR